LTLAATYGMGGATAGARLHKTPEEGQALLDKFFSDFKGVKVAIDYSRQFLRDHGYVEDFMGRRRHLPDYFLPDYEARYKDENKAFENTFNPFINCQDRPQLDSKLKMYLSLAAGCKGNKAFEKLATEAFKDGVILTANTGRKAQAERQCFNARIQGSAATLTKMAMVDIFNDLTLRQYNTHLIIPVHDELLVECPSEHADEVEQLLPQIMIAAAKKGGDNVPQKCDPYNVSRWYCDTAAVAIQDEFKKLEKGDPKKGKAPLSREDALAVLYKKHSEIPQDSIYKVITEGGDLEF